MLQVKQAVVLAVQQKIDLHLGTLLFSAVVIQSATPLVSWKRNATRQLLGRCHSSLDDDKVQLYPPAMTVLKNCLLRDKAAEQQVVGPLTVNAIKSEKMYMYKTVRLIQPVNPPRTHWVHWTWNNPGHWNHNLLA